jgi:peptidoglycan-associated lipoprotein
VPGFPLRCIIPRAGIVNLVLALMSSSLESPASDNILECLSNLRRKNVMKLKLSSFIALVLIALLAGCSTATKKGTGADVVDQSMGGAGGGGVETSGAAGTSSYAGAELTDPSSPLSRRVIYFEYDSDAILPEDQDLITAHATYLNDHPQQMVTLEGNTDERGSPEYNIGLGDRRAQAVKRAFELQGVPAQQITVVSYGEEKPAAEGHSEAAYRLNRRVEIVYVGN